MWAEKCHWRSFQKMSSKKHFQKYYVNSSPTREKERREKIKTLHNYYKHGIVLEVFTGDLI